MAHDGASPASETARPSDAPPPHLPPSYTERRAELPSDSSNNAGLSRQNDGTNTGEGMPERPRIKPEGSAYASAYRPEAAQGNAQLTTVESNHDLGSVPANHDDANASTDRPPAYSESENPGTILDNNGQLGANAHVADDGRVNIIIDQKSRGISQLIVPQLQRQISRAQEDPAPPPPYIPESLGGAPGQRPPPPMNIVIQVVGSRGDVQPFIALGKVLKETYGHRIRLATHATFQDFVTENGLEFFSIGGDPAELMAFMVKNPGLMPGFDTLRSGEVGKRRKGIAEILRGTWRSCIETGDGLGVDPLRQSIEEWMSVEDQLPEQLKKPFVADAIIANPPSFGHLHCAEKLGIPLHMMFTMPWSPTQQFPHPLANVQASNADPTITNFMSYILVDMLTWQGLGDVVNRFRRDSLGLDPISLIWSPAMIERMKIPTTYCWSPALIPKPKDWAQHISISGFFFLQLAQNYTPPTDLAEFLAAGEPPVYIGFGSIVVDDPNAMTKLIFDAVKATGRRALVSKGWGGLGGDELGAPEGVFMLGNCPHDWLFQRVSAVVHHGGAGTTAAGIAAGRPTVVIPFFGDQPFWGAMVAKAGAGPDPIPYKVLTAEKLAGAIRQALKPESLERAKVLSERILQEQGSHNGAQSFHQMLKYDDLRCAVSPDSAAVWRVKRTKVRLSAKAATVLAQEGELSFADLKLYRPREYVPDEGPWDPITGATSAIVGTAGQMMMGVADFPIETLKLLNIHPDSTRKGKAKAQPTDGSSLREAASRTSSDTVLSATSSRTTLPTNLGQETSNSRNSSVTELPSRRSGSGPSSPHQVTERCGFMAQAMSSASQVSHSRSSSRDRALLKHTSSHGRTPSAADLHNKSGTLFSEQSFVDKLGNMNQESIVGTGKGVGRIVGAGFKSPMDFSMNVAQGFHNVPKLYGAEVRQVDKVTDFQSGLRTAAKQFGLGLYDGITGLVTDPIKGAKKEGGLGFVKGVGRGIFSIPFRVMDGAFSVPAYAMKGLYQEMLKSKGSSVQNYIIAARISQGYDEASVLPPGEKADIVSAWRCIKTNVKKKKNPGEEQLQALHTLMSEKKKKKQERWARFKNGDSSSLSVDSDGASSLEPASRVQTSSGASTTSHKGFRFPGLSHAHTFPEIRHTHHDEPAHKTTEKGPTGTAEDPDLEAAIKLSVAGTSKGDPDEDALIARAIRASMAELQRKPAAGETEEEALNRAMQASLSEAQKSGVSQEEQRVLEATLRHSMLETSKRSKGEHGTDSEWDSSDTEDDEDFRRMAAESKQMHDLHQAAAHDDYYASVAGADKSVDSNEKAALRKQEEEEAIRKAIEESQRHDRDRMASTDKHDDDDEAVRKAIEESHRHEQERLSAMEKQRTEEDIVLEYVKKQSLMEDEHKRRTAQGRDVNGEGAANA